MDTATLISIEEYLDRSFEPDCDYVDGELVERNVGKRRHSYAQGHIVGWFLSRLLNLEAFPELRMRLSLSRIRIPDVVVTEPPIPDEEVFTSPPYLCIEIMSPDDTMAGMQDRIDDYLAFGVSNVWVIDPWKHRGWRVTPAGWAVAADKIMRTGDSRVEMPLSDVLLP